MHFYEIHKDIGKIVILRDGDIHWSITHGILGLSFTATSSDNLQYKLVSKGLFFWRSFTLYEADKEIDSLSFSKTTTNEINLRRNELIYENDNYLFTLYRHREESPHGQKRLSWQSEKTEIEPSVFSLLAINILTSGHAFASAVP
ncbi:MAG: hypothetical protein K6L73_14635 [Cellvibrionaceae bacterium]